MKKWMPFQRWLEIQGNSQRRDRIGEIAEHWDWRDQRFHNPEWVSEPRDQAWLDEAWEYARREWLRECYAPPSFVYLLQAGDCIKIGFTTDPKGRPAELQTGNPHKLLLIAMFAGDVGAERRLQARFQAHRLEGEWFKAEPVLAWLETLLK